MLFVFTIATSYQLPTLSEWGLQDFWLVI